MENNNNKTTLHPNDWPIDELLLYCYDNNISTDKVSSKKQLIDLVLKDELDKE